MRSRWTRSFMAAAVVTVASCTDSTAPTANTDMVLDFCADQIPAFFAYQNEGGAWTPVAGDANGTFSFKATDRFAVAVIHQVGSQASSEFIFATTSDMQPFNNVACTETAGSKTLTGTVAGMPLGYAAWITMAGSYTYVTAPSNSYSLSGIPNGTVDLIAQRETATNPVTPDKIIVRRAQNLASTIPVLDFSSTEAQNILTNTLTITGLTSGESNYLRQDFNTPTTPKHSLASLSNFTSATQTLFGVPNTQAGDLHEMNVEADASSGTSYRGETHYFRAPTSRTSALGATLNAPTLTQATPSPYVRLRVSLPSQAEYGSLVSGYFEQNAGQSNDRIVVMTVTAGYVGNTPSTWQFEVPDLSGVQGFPTSAMLQSGTNTTWYVDAYGGSPAAFMGKPADGVVLHYAGRTSAIATMQQYQAGARPRGRSIQAARIGLGSFR